MVSHVWYGIFIRLYVWAYAKVSGWLDSADRSMGNRVHDVNATVEAKRCIFIYLFVCSFVALCSYEQCFVAIYTIIFTVDNVLLEKCLYRIFSIQSANILYTSVAVIYILIIATKIIIAGQQTKSEGAQTSILVAASEDLKDVSGKYFEDCKVSTYLLEPLPLFIFLIWYAHVVIEFALQKELMFVMITFFF